jgi:hypothetical protein
MKTFQMMALLAKKGSLLPGAAISLQDVSSTIALILSQCTTATRESFKFVYGTNRKIVMNPNQQLQTSKYQQNLFRTQKFTTLEILQK